MHASLRPYATAGVALLGASVIAVTPIAAPPSDVRVSNVDVNLAAASIFNIPANLINAVLNMPAASIADMGRFAAAMEASGSWHESSAGNVWGWDPPNPEMLKGFIGMLMPFPALSHPLGEHLNWWAAANLPMHAGCAYECPDLGGMLNSMFRVPPWEFWDADGYTFGDVINPVDGQHTEWSGKTVRLDPWEPVKSVIDYLLADPVRPTFPTMYEVITAVANLASSLQTTGHLPDWIAVREIEKFFKYFFPAPAAEASETETETEPSSDPTPDTSVLATSLDEPFTPDADVADARVAAFSDSAFGVSAQRGVASDDALTTTDTDTDTDTPISVDTTVETGTTQALDTDEVDPGAAEAEQDVDDGEKDEPKRLGGKHRKPAFDLSDTVKSVQEKFDATAKNATDSAKDRDADDRGATAKSGARAKAGAGSGGSDGE